MTLNMQDAPLLIVALIVLAGVFLYLWRMDTRLRAMELELRDELDRARETSSVLPREVAERG